MLKRERACVCVCGLLEGACVGLPTRRPAARERQSVCERYMHRERGRRRTRDTGRERECVREILIERGREREKKQEQAAGGRRV